jgi:nucleoside 2-deoxyribosyltransferase
VNSKFKVYLAGPEVFLSNASEVLSQKIAICERFGLVGLAPVDDGTASMQPTQRAAAMAICRGNVSVMDQADAVIANITPFRGPHMDPGTAFELGYCAAKGKTIICYTQQDADLLDRVIAWSGDQELSNDGRIRDRNGHSIEDFGLKENLMIESTVNQQGHGLLVSSVDPSRAFACVLGFEDAARYLSDYLLQVKK